MSDRAVHSQGGDQPAGHAWGVPGQAGWELLQTKVSGQPSRPQWGRPQSHLGLLRPLSVLGINTLMNGDPRHLPVLPVAGLHPTPPVPRQLTLVPGRLKDPGKRVSTSFLGSSHQLPPQTGDTTHQPDPESRTFPGHPKMRPSGSKEDPGPAWICPLEIRSIP